MPNRPTTTSLPEEYYASLQQFSTHLQHAIASACSFSNLIAVMLKSDRPPPHILTAIQVVTGLATLQSAVQDLSHAYIAHTNTVLGRAPGTSLNLLALANPLENGLLAQRPISPITKADVEEPKKKRKRAPHDPNAPKRALTPYFLYMQTARSKIAAELGASAKPKDVADEGTRRWATMPESEKKIWHVQYGQNLAAYREKMAAYKAGKLDGEAAQQLIADTEGAGAAGLDAIAGVASEEEEEEEEEEEPSPEPPKAPTPPRATQAKRRKTAAEPKAAPTPAKEVASPAVSKKEAEKAKSPEKKKKSKKEKEADAEKVKKAAAETAKAEATPKEKKGRKKRKSEAISDA